MGDRRGPSSLVEPLVVFIPIGELLDAINSALLVSSANKRQANAIDMAPIPPLSLSGFTAGKEDGHHD